MKPQAPYVWFVEPIGRNHDQTNKVISELLPSENAISDVRCSDGREHNLWKCTSYETVNKLNSCSSGMRLCFNIWVQKTRNSAIRPWLFRRRSRISPKVLFEHAVN